MSKLSKNTLEKRLKSALKKIKELIKLYEKLWNDYHIAQRRIIFLEEENHMLRDHILEIEGRE